MYALASVHRKTQLDAKHRITLRRAFERAQVVGAVVGLFGGAASAVFGSVFTAASWLVDNDGARQWLSNAGTALLFLTIPLLIFGGYCMDWVEKGKPQSNSKIARYQDEDDDEEQ